MEDEIYAEPIGVDPSSAKRERLRDEMAMAAMATRAPAVYATLEGRAHWCYEFADAMLKAREAK